MPLTQDAGFSFPVNVFRFAVSFSTDPSARAIGGFQQADGLPAEYRPGNAGFSPIKIPGAHKAGDVTLKRGVVDGSTLSGWINSVRDGRGAGAGVRITLYDEAGTPVVVWTLTSAKPKKWTGPTLSGSSGPTSLEELVLSCENIRIIKR